MFDATYLLMIPCQRSAAAIHRVACDHGQFLILREELREARVAQEAFWASSRRSSWFKESTRYPSHASAAAYRTNFCDLNFSCLHHQTILSRAILVKCWSSYQPKGPSATCNSMSCVLRRFFW